MSGTIIEKSHGLMSKKLIDEMDKAAMKICIFFEQFS